MTVLWLDKYERQARLVPGLLAFLPVAITISALGLRQAPVISAVVSVLSLAGGPVLLADIVRSLGLKAQDRLWSSWGGAPTTLALRLRESALNEVQRDIWRTAVQKVTGIQFASARSESANPQRADQSIESAIARVRELTRDDQRFYVLQAENRSYGYRRNLYGVRNLGRVVALLGAITIMGFALWPLIGGKHPDLQAAYTLGFAVDVVVAGCWFLPSSTQVRQAGDKYTNQLLQAAVTLADQPSDSATPAAGQTNP